VLKGSLEWTKGLKPWVQGRITKVAFGEGKLGKGSCPYVFSFQLICFGCYYGLRA